ncbi:GNAT family N-acetyltransferase [Corallococcus sp. RDP092CA]|uniref:GNAT family N-acetyltransferase n=1 Tax=Corallococcus sp. RDP092CA TaxID=3109369 RepID=UPI0035ADB4BE
MTRVEEFPGERWDELVPTLLGGGPYQTAAWGRSVEAAFGGRFQVLTLVDEARYFIPVLSGSALARDGFLCGHVGYGGVFHESLGAGLPLSRQLEVLGAVEQSLGLGCRRFVSSPSPQKLFPSHVPGLATTLQPLPSTAEALPKVYSGNVRNMLKRCEKDGLTARPLGPQDFEVCLSQIQQTQARVNASYQTPRALLQALFSAGEGFFLGMGCWQGERLLSVGVFLCSGARVAYYLNGWDRDSAGLSPNYLMLHETFRACVQRGHQVVDLGYSHSDALRASKLRWGGAPAFYMSLVGGPGRTVHEAYQQAVRSAPA